MEQAVDGFVSDSLGIEHIAGDQHGIDTLRGRQAGEPLDGCEARLGQQGSVIGVELAELLPDLPVGGVK